MKIVTMLSSFLASLLVLGTAPLAGQPSPPPPPPASAIPTTTNLGPRIQFQNSAYDFGKVKSGDSIQYAFVFTNTGDASLVLSNVQPSCGCTTAGQWSRQVEPGQTGSIPIQYNTTGHSGQVLKTVAITCNDRSRPSIALQLTGNIWNPIEVQPRMAILTIPPETETNVTTIVRLVNNMAERVDIWGPESNQKSFAATLRTNVPGREFQVTISALPPFEPGAPQGQISLKTSSTNVPTLWITAWANVQPTVAIQPPQVLLPPGPLAAPQTVSITLQNNSATPLALTEPAVDRLGVEVRLIETAPGRLFTASLTFPAGFDLASGNRGQLSMKSSQPRSPVIKVPILQMPKAL